MRSRLRLFRYSAFDAIPTIGCLANVALLVVLALFFDQMPLWAIALSFVLVAFCYSWNLNSISHNFIHNPFFESEWLNRGYSVVSSLAIGVPQTFFHHYHMTHHWGNNDAKGPDGKTKDLTSTYLHSKDEATEGLWRYSLMSFFRFDFGACFKMMAAYGRGPFVQAAVEALTLIGFWAVLFAINWHYLLFFYIPSYYAGWVWSYAQNYSLHYGAQPGNRYANAVCSYHKLYNLVFFNNGYHQEHHCNPKAHWTRVREVRDEIMPGMIANQTRFLRGPHLTFFFEAWLDRRAHRAPLTVTSVYADTKAS